MKYAWITRHRDSYPIALMCETLAVSKSGYCDSPPLSDRGWVGYVGGRASERGEPHGNKARGVSGSLANNSERMQPV